MARPRNTIPAYRKHKHTGRAAVSIYRADGSRTEVILPGKFGSIQSKHEYERLLEQLRDGNGRLPAKTVTKDNTVSEFVLKYMSHAETYYVDPATNEPTTERSAIVEAARPLVRLFGQE